MMSKLKTSCVFSAAAFVLVFASASANAQATRTWVSGVGDDANPCSRTAPCKTFAGAISKTAPGGEISTLDPGGFGAVTITKSISITNDNAGEAGILAASTTGVIVNAAGIDVNLRGIVIDGGTPSLPGVRGVRFMQGNSLTIQNCVIRNFTGGGVAIGVDFTPAASAKLTIRDTHISRNGINPATGGAIQIKPTGGFSSVTLTRVTMDNNSNGFVADSTLTSGAILATILDSSASANANTGIAMIGDAVGSNSFVAVDRSASSNNTNGVATSGANARVLLSNTVVTGNTTGLSASGGAQIISFSNNMFNGNTTEGAATSTVAAQ